MAARTDVKVQSPTEDWPRCEICGWWDRKLRAVGSSLLPVERILVHKWARHGHILPPFLAQNPEPKEGD